MYFYNKITKDSKAAWLNYGSVGQAIQGSSLYSG